MALHLCNYASLFRRNLNNIPLSGASLAVESDTANLSLLLSRYARGLGIPAGVVHPAEYSTDLSPVFRKGVDLCDYTEIRERNAIDVQTLTDEAIAQDRAAQVSKNVQESPQAPPPSSTSGE